MNGAPEAVVLYPLVQARAERHVDPDAVVLAGSPARDVDQARAGAGEREAHHDGAVGHGEPRVVGAQDLDVRADGVAQPPPEVVGRAEAADQEDGPDGFPGGRDLLPDQLDDFDDGGFKDFLQVFGLEFIVKIKGDLEYFG